MPCGEESQLKPANLQQRSLRLDRTSLCSQLRAAPVARCSDRLVERTSQDFLVPCLRAWVRRQRRGRRKPAPISFGPQVPTSMTDPGLGLASASSELIAACQRRTQSARYGYMYVHACLAGAVSCCTSLVRCPCLPGHDGEARARLLLCPGLPSLPDLLLSLPKATSTRHLSPLSLPQEILSLVTEDHRSSSASLPIALLPDQASSLPGQKPFCHRLRICFRHCECDSASSPRPSLPSARRTVAPSCKIANTPLRAVAEVV